MAVRVKRVYAAASTDDGHRVLVDRIWPRGLRRGEARVHRWLKEVAPSAELRRWFGHDPARWDEFRRRYAGELETRGEAVELLRGLARDGTLTLLFAARDERYNNAVALKEYLEENLGFAPASPGSRPPR